MVYIHKTGLVLHHVTVIATLDLSSLVLSCSQHGIFLFLFWRPVCQIQYVQYSTRKVVVVVVATKLERFMLFNRCFFGSFLAAASSLLYFVTLFSASCIIIGGGLLRYDLY